MLTDPKGKLISTITVNIFTVKSQGIYLMSVLYSKCCTAIFIFHQKYFQYRHVIHSHCSILIEKQDKHIDTYSSHYLCIVDQFTQCLKHKAQYTCRRVFEIISFILSLDRSHFYRCVNVLTWKSL